MRNGLAKAGIGRPSKYRPEFCDLVRAEMGRGHSIDGFAGLVGASRNAIDGWRKSHPEFEEAVQAGQVAQARFWEGELIRIARGGRGTAGASIFALRNVSPHWRVAERAAREAVAVGAAVESSDSGAVAVTFRVVPAGHMLQPDGTLRPVSGELLELAREAAAEGVFDGATYGLSDA